MAEYIEREKAIHAARYTAPMMPSQSLSIVHAIESIPAADVRPVVLCRDCMLRQCCKVAQYLGEDGFCSKGEKREES